MYNKTIYPINWGCIGQFHIVGSNKSTKINTLPL